MIFEKSSHEGPLRINLSGTPYQIGLLHGRTLSLQIRRQISVYTAMFAQTSALTWPNVLAIAAPYAATIKKLTPDLYIEMTAVAAGAEVDVLDVVALNCRSEIALGLFSDGCTSLGWRLPGNREEVLLGQNWDWTARVKENLVFMSIEPEGKPRIWMVTEAGIVGKIGFNERGVGVCLNAIRAKPTLDSKIPIHVALRLCLEAGGKEEAVETLERLGGIASSAHILIADVNEPLGLELSPLGNAYLKPDANGIVCHTNHFVENKLVEEPPWLSGSPLRLKRVQELTKELAAGGEVITAEILRKRVFSDGKGKPQAICCEEDEERPVETRSSTLFCVVMRFVRGERPSAEVVWERPGSGEEGSVLRMPW